MRNLENQGNVFLSLHILINLFNLQFIYLFIYFVKYCFIYFLVLPKLTLRVLAVSKFPVKQVCLSSDSEELSF